MLVIVAMFGIVGLSYALFATSANVNGAAFSFKEMSTLVSYGTQTDQKSINISVGSLASGGKVLSAGDLKVKLGGELKGFIRARVDYKVKSGLSGDSLSNAQKMVIALNSLEAKNSYTTATNTNAKWTYYASDDCYYLTSGSSTTNLLSASAGTYYTLFANNSISFPNVNDFKLNLGTESINTVLNNINFCIAFEAVQSEYSNITTIVQLTQEMSKLFKDTDTTKGFIVTYNSQGGTVVNSSIVVGTSGSVKLPTINNVVVEWYKSTNFTPTNKAGESNATITVETNLDLYAKYKENGVFYVFFEANGATSGSMPASMSVSYATSGSVQSGAYSADLAKTGYVLKSFSVKGSNTTLSYNSTNRTITIPKNLGTVNSAVTIIPIWENSNAEINFNVEDKRSLSYLNGCLYSKSSSQYYKCSHCNNYSTSSTNDVGCTGHQHTFVQSGYYCPTCGYTSNASHINLNSAKCTTCASCGTCNGTGQQDCTYKQKDKELDQEYHCKNGEIYLVTTDGDEEWWCTCALCKGTGKIVCRTCNGTGCAAGKTLCSKCRGYTSVCDNRYVKDGYEFVCINGYIYYGLIDESDSVDSGILCGKCNGTGYANECTTCKGTGNVNCLTCGGDGLMDTTTNHTTVAYKCSTCGNMSTSNSGTGCKHNYSLVGYLYSKQYGSISGDFYSTNNLETGYYWNDTYGALKVGSFFTKDGLGYKVETITNSKVIARRQTNL